MSRRITVLAVFASLAFFAAIATVYRPLTEGSVKTYEITLNEDGFSPTRVEVEVGDTITFGTTLPRPFWPASDPHPAHDLYAAFDPKHPLSASEQWSFAFNESGVWNFHNHLDPSNRGTIVVRDAVSGTVPASDCTYEKAAAGDARCFEEEVRTSLAEGGLSEGWRVFKRLFEAGKAPRSCHWTAHFIGEETYSLFKEGREIPLSSDTSFCGYGFYHGFMGKLLHDSPDPARAVAFCEEVRSQLGAAAQNNCYHGIGHGFTPETVLRADYGDPKALLAAPFAVCRALFRADPLTESICNSGAFDVLGEYMSEGAFGFSLDTSDPFAVCFALDGRHMDTCIGQIAPKLDSIAGWDPSRVPDYMGRVSDPAKRQEIVRIAVGTMMQRDIVLTNWDGYVGKCHALPEELQASCVNGLVWGMVMHGEPQREEEKPLAFCSNGILSSTERSACYGHLAHWLRLIYPADRIALVCDAVPVAYRDSCTRSISE